MVIFKKRSLVAAALMYFLVLCALFDSPAVKAQGGILLTTEYPGIVAKPGEKVEFPLTVSNNTSINRQVDLKIVESPEGWEAWFKHYNREVFKTLITPGNTSNLDFEVKVPDDARAAVYAFKLQAVSGGYSSQLALEIKVDPKGAAGTSLVTDYPVLRGPSDARFKFGVDLVNDSAYKQMYSLSAAAPMGWEVYFNPSYKDERIASIALDAGATKGLEVNIKPPRFVKEGEYKIKIKAVGSRSSAETELKVVITGDYKLNLTTETGLLNMMAVAGRENSLKLKVENFGTKDLHNITFGATEPSSWKVKFDPEKIKTLPAGESRTVTAIITPAPRAIAGDYAFSISASTENAYDDFELRVTVKTSTLWGIVGVVIIMGVFAGVYWLFNTYGRR